MIQIKQKHIIAGLSLLWIVLVMSLAFFARTVIYRFGPLPEQPVQFSHTLHINQLNMECTYCHKYPYVSPKATLPPTQICRDCHEGAGIDRPEAKKLEVLLEKYEEIPWQRVYQVKDHVYFSHRVHTVVAKLECQECHGDIQHMTVAVRAAGGSSDRGFLEMGWCVTCHKKRGAPRDCNVCHK